MFETGKALTPAEQRAQDFQRFDHQLEEQAANMKIMLPSHVPVAKFRRVVMTACIQDPKLFHADRRSLFVAAQKCASDGLLPDGREAVLLAFNTRVKETLPDRTTRDVWKDIVTYIPMVQGIRTRMRNTGLVASAEAHVVYRNDKFFQQFGSDPKIVHEPPTLGTPRGDPVGAYAIIRLVSGEKIMEVMDRDEIDRVRSFSRNKDGPAWRGHWGEMARKTILKRAAKSAPTSAEMLQLLERDEEAPDTGMVDVTGAAYEEPEPQRQIAGEPQPGVTYAVIDADGEEHEYKTPNAAEEALRLIFADAARRNRAALDAAAENNAEVMRALNLAELAAELAADLDPFGLPPLPTEQPPQEAAERPGASPPAGNGTRQGEPSPPPAAADEGHNLFVPLPRRPTGADLEYYARQMLAMIGEEPLTAQRAALIKGKNEGGIGWLKLKAVARYDEVQRALNQKVETADA